MEQYIIENDRYFSRSAKFYDSSTWLVSHLRRRLYRAANAGREDKILDVATGTGTVALTFANAGHPFVTGIDLSEDMLAIARSKKKRSSVEFIRGDASVLPFSDGSFDKVTISFALHDMPDEIRIKAISEMYRVLKSSGNLVIMDYARPANPLWAAITYSIINAYEGIYFKDFMNQNFEITLKSCSFRVIRLENFLLGAVQLMVCEPVH